MPEKRTFRFGFPAEDGYGYAQAVEAGGTLYVSGQVAFAPSGAVDPAQDAEAQMRRAYANARAVLAHFGAGPEAVVDELVFLKGGLAGALEWVGQVRKEVLRAAPRGRQHDRGDAGAGDARVDGRDQDGRQALRTGPAGPVPMRGAPPGGGRFRFAWTGGKASCVGH